LNLCQQRNHHQRKSRELENLLAEKILTKTAYLKSATAKKRFEFLSQLSKRNLRIKDGFVLLFGSAPQRFALPALGRGRRSRPTRKRLRRRKLPEIAAESPASGARFVRRRCNGVYHSNIKEKISIIRSRVSGDSYLL